MSLADTNGSATCFFKSLTKPQGKPTLLEIRY